MMAAVGLLTACDPSKDDISMPSSSFLTVSHSNSMTKPTLRRKKMVTTSPSRHLRHELFASIRRMQME